MPEITSRMYKLSIPFKLIFSHSEASRSACDSQILEVGSGNEKGYGELLLRSYVNDPRGILNSDERIAGRLKEMLGELTCEGMPGMAELSSFLLKDSWEKQDLPLLAAVEAAFLDLICRKQNKDIYELIGREPLRDEIRYGGILPILSPGAMEKILQTYLKMAIPYIRIKLSADYGYNDGALSLAREILGDGFDIRVDVNCGWDIDAAVKHLDLLRSRGVALVEEPLGALPEKMRILAKKSLGSGVGYVADESAVLFSDLDGIIKDGTFTMLNLRIAKNGGLLRVLAMSEKADDNGLTYQLGSHVGETGILSVMGRIAASLMKTPLYADGSFDDHILTDNITRRSYTFGMQGRAPVIRGNKMGYDVAKEKLVNPVDLL